MSSARMGEAQTGSLYRERERAGVRGFLPHFYAVCTWRRVSGGKARAIATAPSPTIDEPMNSHA